MNCKSLLVPSVVMAATAAFADFDGGPKGIKINDRILIRPYVGFSYTYDSNIDSGKHGKGTSSWTITPGASTSLKGDRWHSSLAAHYSYHAYESNSHRLNNSSYSINGSYGWTTGLDNERGWSFVASGSYSQTSQDDDMSKSDGRGIGRDRQSAHASAGVEHRFTSRVHAGANMSFNYLDFDNNVDKYADMYGWQLCNIGVNAGYVVSPKIDISLSSSFQGFWQDNHKGSNNNPEDEVRGHTRSSHSKGWTVHLGISTRATTRIRYNLSGGWSHFDYGGSAKAKDSFTYSTSGSWKVSPKTSLMWVGSSYYQPSERETNAACKNYSLSAGLARSMIRGRMSSNLNVSYRHQVHTTYEYKSDDYTEDIITLRLGLNYTLNQFMGLFGSVEYQTCMGDGSGIKNNAYDYDRWRATVGFRLTY